MLKFKVTNSKMGVDLRRLDIIKVERQDGTSIDVPDGDFGSVINHSDDVTFKFWVKDLHTVQDGSHLTSITELVINNDNIEHPELFKKVNHIQDVIVTSACRANNFFTINVKKEIDLNINKIFVETRYNLIRYVNNRWEKMSVDRAWLDSEIKKADNYQLIETDDAAYGKNGRGILNNNGELVSDNTIFYYENDTWNEISLFGDNLEGCLSSSKINFNSIHEYDNTERRAIELNKDFIYYTRENYVIIEFHGTHFFGSPNEVKKIDVGEDISMYATTEYGREIIEKIDYPKLYLYLNKYNDSTQSLEQLRIEKECHIENETKLIFNYDNFSNDGLVVGEVSEWVLGNDALPLNKKKVSQKSLGDDISIFNDNVFPNGIVHNSKDDIPFQEGSLGSLIVKRGNLMYDDPYGTFDLVFDTAVNIVQIPLTQKFENDLHHNDMLKTNFVEKAKSMMINPIIDMEKDLYTPAIHKGGNKDGEYSQVNAKYDDAYKIIFNLHFREHRDTVDDNENKEEWKCKRDCYWNGTRVLEKKLDEKKSKELGKKTVKVVDLKGRVFNYKLDKLEISETNKHDYFSYYKNPPKNPENEKPHNYDGNIDYDINKLNYADYKAYRDKRNELKEYQSDLLSYLGFSNNDVKYQKSKLKKSFLRISFYDSDNIANQNLLHTSTIFIDSGELFAKYVKNINTEEEYKVENTVKNIKTGKTYQKGSIIDVNEYNSLALKNENNQDDDHKKKCLNNGEPLAVIGTSLTDKETHTVYNVNGVRVNREPMRNEKFNKKNEKVVIDVDKGDLGDNIGEFERLRLSSQFVVADKYSSKHSSEGFYFYTYKTNDGGVFPNDIYMRVEFNHAGYGRTIPFMMPYIRKSEEDPKIGTNRYKGRKGKIKTFDDICYDWSEIDFDKDLDTLKEDDKIGYGTARYMKYCHIKWKYRYDKATQKHIYYLDPDVYGESVTTKNGHDHNIILNLYEGKIR
jgi:hypothetical protein|nr:MAG TPA: hypothetical protein [Herelleviridae sp.]